MNNAQLLILKNDIAADPGLSVIPNTPDGNAEISDIYNQDSTLDIWRSNIPASEYIPAIVWTDVDGLTLGKARIWEWITNRMTAPLDLTKPAVRQGLNDCWNNTATKIALLAIAKRKATRAEELVSFEGKIIYQDIKQAREL